MNLRVAGTQMQVTPDVGQNTADLRRAIRQARQAGADILLTPEGALNGYTPDFDPAAVEAGLAEVTFRKVSFVAQREAKPPTRPPPDV